MFTTFYAVIFSLFAVLFLLCAVANSSHAVLFSLCTELESLYAVLFFLCAGTNLIYAVFFSLCTRETFAQNPWKKDNESGDERKNHRKPVRETRNHLFQPNRSSSSGGGRKRKSACPQSQKQWSFQFVLRTSTLSRHLL